MSQAKVLLWDFDGTLAFRPGLWSEALAEALREEEPATQFTAEDFRPFLREGFPWHQPDVAHLHLATAEQWWNEIESLLARAYLGLGFSDQEARHYAQRAHYKYLEPSGWTVFEDTLPTLDALCAQGWTHAILSNHVPELADLTAGIGLDRYISLVLSSACIGYEKPHPQAFEIARKAVGRPERIWMIGDSYKADIAGAEAAGIPAIMVRCEAATARRSCQSLREVTAFLTGQ